MNSAWSREGLRSRGLLSLSLRRLLGLVSAAHSFVHRIPVTRNLLEGSGRGQCSVFQARVHSLDLGQALLEASDRLAKSAGLLAKAAQLLSDQLIVLQAGNNALTANPTTRSGAALSSRPMVDRVPPAPPRPLLRGVLHQAAFVISLLVAPLLILGAVGTRRRVAAAVFAGSVAACFGSSALYHRVTWTPRVRLWMRRIDHAGVYILIAGTYTPVSLLVLNGNWRVVVLTIAWAGAAAAIVLKFAWVAAPKWLSAVIGIALGWVAVVALPQLITHLDPVALILLVAGGLAYTAGAVVYARRWPDPLPSVFGYHELFHALTIVAAACQYVAIAFFIVRTG